MATARHLGQPAARVERLGLTPLRGTRWLSLERLELDQEGVVGDRCWTAVDEDLRCPRATDRPDLVALRVDLADLERLTPVGERTVRYYDREVPAEVHEGPAAEALSAELGRRVRLARALVGGFVWAEPVSVLLLSELRRPGEERDLPGEGADLDRYRANVVVDDRERPLTLAPGDRLELGGTLLEVGQPLTRCLIIDHHPVTGHRDHALLGRLRPGVLLGHGARVLRGGSVTLGDELRPNPAVGG